jgi:hypothetical protein
MFDSCSTRLERLATQHQALIIRLNDRVHGDWFKMPGAGSASDPDYVQVGPWGCPYHHSRMCFEMLERLQ